MSRPGDIFEGPADRPGAPPTHRPSLPRPQRTRWQPLRLGLIELFHYDSEEFWFRDGHLLLRGNNGTGKSKVLSLTLPFLFDAQLKPSRIEPDGDAGKRMAWNLLMGRHERRLGYAWIEFGRLDETTGEPRYLTLGAGLSAVAARAAVDPWYFVVEGGSDAPRINDGLWLTSPQRVTLTRERLREAIGTHGQVFESGQAYRRVVDERLFGLGEARYAALMDTLIQLRQPQLSKRPDEGALSDALTEALPPLAAELLADVADALARLEEDRRHLEDFRALQRTVERFEQRYRLYAGTRSRRQARGLRQAQTEVDNASRTRHEAAAALTAALATETAAIEALQQTELSLERCRTRVQTLIDDPTQQDARRLDEAARDADQRHHDVGQAELARDAARQRLEAARSDTARSAERVQVAGQQLDQLRQTWSAKAAGVLSSTALAHAHVAADPRLTLAPERLADLAPRELDRADTALARVLAERAEQVGTVRRRLDEVDAARGEHRRCEQLRDERKTVFDDALATREAADAAVDGEATAHVEAWSRHAATLVRLALAAPLPLEALAQWARSLDGEDPLRTALLEIREQQRASLADQRAAIGWQRNEARARITALEAEHQSLASGDAPLPPAPHTRNPALRDPTLGDSALGDPALPGAPFWQLVDFRDDVPAERRAGLEAALEAAGLLDAWVFPDGRIDEAVGQPSWHDTRLVDRSGGADLADPPGPSYGVHPADRPATATTLASYLVPDPPRDDSGEAVVAIASVQRLLATIAAGDSDPVAVEHWVAPDGRFRVGAIAGAWQKPAAVYIGLTAREAARQARLAAIETSLQDLADEVARLDAALDELATADREGEAEWQQAPDGRGLRDAHARASVQEQGYRRARERLGQADEALQTANQALQAGHQRLLDDATDLGLPADRAGLEIIDEGLAACRSLLQRLAETLRELRSAWPEWQRQRERETACSEDLAGQLETLTERRALAEQAAERLTVLTESVGLQVEELRAQLRQARDDEAETTRQVQRRRTEQGKAGEARAVCATLATRADQDLEQASQRRTTEVEHLRQFVASGLLQSALPDVEPPDPATTWTVDPALTLARRIDAQLQSTRDDDDAWQRIQRQINEARTELQGALGALGHHVHDETTDWGIIVRIIYQNRPERPDRLLLILADEITQRSELLTANEREILENHLQAEIAAEIQRLLQEADRQLAGVNDELQRRPTSTGVRFRLRWEPLTEAEGAPAGLEAVRRSLVNVSTDLWTAEDRRRIGDMLSARIQAESTAAEAGAAGAGGGGGALVDQLARALDYRRWHRFRIERWQDGSWRKLSGPASSGERALGLTVPLFAAVASFYSRSPNPHAPRLILLDEAFAGIDDAARAHCMGLVAEFDLDFVITSEREWACYAELPGVSICQLLRREGIDAVYVSRWTWDGQARQPEGDPDRRFPPVAEVGEAADGRGAAEAGHRSGGG